MTQWSSEQIKTAWTQLNVSLVCLVVSGIVLSKLIRYLLFFLSDNNVQTFDWSILWYLLAIPCGGIAFFAMIRSLKICFSWDNRARQSQRSRIKPD